MTALSVKHSSKSNECYTPPTVVELARSVLGQIDLDPATSELANRLLVKAQNIFTLADGPESTFERQWHGNVFLNPPGGRLSSFKGVGYGSNPALFWAKLMHSWWVERTVRAAVVVGFTLEVLQTTQGVDFEGERLPMARFPLCVPRRRLAFWVPREDRIKQLQDRLAAEKRPQNIRVLNKKLESVLKLESELVPGDDPPHSNVIICVPPVEECYHFQGVVVDRFCELFDSVGYVRV